MVMSLLKSLYKSLYKNAKDPTLSILGHHGGRRKVASLRPPFTTPLRSLGEPDPDTPFLVPIEHAPPLFVRIWEDKISLKIPPPPLRVSGKLFGCWRGLSTYNNEHFELFSLAWLFPHFTRYFTSSCNLQL